MKSLYLYSLPGPTADGMRAALTADPLAFTELRLDRDSRIHHTDYAGRPVVVIDVEGTAYAEFPPPYDHAALVAAFATAPKTLPPPPVDPRVQAFADAETIAEKAPAQWSAVEAKKMTLAIWYKVRR